MLLSVTSSAVAGDEKDESSGDGGDGEASVDTTLEDGGVELTGCLLSSAAAAAGVALCGNKCCSKCASSCLARVVLPLAGQPTNSTSGMTKMNVLYTLSYSGSRRSWRQQRAFDRSRRDGLAALSMAGRRRSELEACEISRLVRCRDYRHRRYRLSRNCRCRRYRY